MWSPPEKPSDITLKINAGHRHCVFDAHYNLLVEASSVRRLHIIIKLYLETVPGDLHGSVVTSLQAS